MATSSVNSPGRLSAWWSRPEIHRVFAIWAVMTIALVIFSLNVPARLMGPPASPTMHAVEQTMTVFTVAASPVAALVWAIALYSVITWRHTGSTRPESDGPAIRTDRPVTLIWVIVSSVLCVFLLVWGLAEMQSASAASRASNPLVVDVTGQQWVWTFSYPGEGGAQSDQLYLPVNRPVVFDVTSDDVIHSFWIVQMGIKVDANPGEVTTTSTTPNKLGIFDVRCAELCGLLHADMETTAHVVSATDFASWVTANGGHP
jgi:cytochrome c oxidase subunit II